MAESFVRVAAVSPEVSVGNPAENAVNIEKLVRKAAMLGARVIVTPELSLTGYTCGELFLQDTLLSAAKEALASLVSRSAGREEIAIVGLPLVHRGKLYNAAAVYSNGTLHAFVPKTQLPTYGEFYELRHFSPAPAQMEFAILSNWDITPDESFPPKVGFGAIHIVREEQDSDFYVRGGFPDEGFPEDGMDGPIPGLGSLFGPPEVPFGTNLIFRCEEDNDFAFAIEICEDLWAPNPPSLRHAAAGATVICNLSAGDETIGKADYRRLLTQSQSGKLLCGYVYAGAGMGESTTDMVFSGHSMIAENGIILAESKPFSQDAIVISEIDVKGLVHDRRYMNTFETASAKEREKYLELYFSQPDFADASPNPDRSKVIHLGMPGKKHVTYRHIDPHPFVPSDSKKRSERAESILKIQTVGLLTRLRASGAKSAIVGVSGGLDSTLALLVTVRAAEFAGMDRKSVIAVTMPAFGTTERTKNNAHALATALGVRLMEINLTDTVLSHMSDIGHSEDVHDVVYENAQARMRTLTLMDIANAEGGLVVGTGDLSELALGWATYNGDHMSMYGVNAGVPKTLVRHIIKYVSDEAAKITGEISGVNEAALAEVLNDILDTPVSPELLPPEDGDISQKTEELVGPYELHDFFLYHMVRFGRSPRIIFGLASTAFEGVYDAKTIRSWLLVFVKRFFANQFKRSALPDGPKVGSVTLSPRGDWRMPSDANAASWVAEIESIEV